MTEFDTNRTDKPGTAARLANTLRGRLSLLLAGAIVIGGVSLALTGDNHSAGDTNGENPSPSPTDKLPILKSPTSTERPIITMGPMTSSNLKWSTPVGVNKQATSTRQAESSATAVEITRRGRANPPSTTTRYIPTFVTVTPVPGN